MPLISLNQDDRLSLIHIPLSSYSAFVQPILQLLFPINAGRPSQTSDRARFSALSTLSAGRGPTSGSSLPWQARHPFLNIAINSVECSILCSTALADRYFAPVISQQLRDERPQARERRGSEFTERDRPEISDVDFVAISVEGEGMGAGQRVVELSSPLALAGMYVPLCSLSRAVSALITLSFLFISGFSCWGSSPTLSEPACRSVSTHPHLLLAVFCLALTPLAMNTSSAPSSPPSRRFPPVPLGVFCSLLDCLCFFLSSPYPLPMSKQRAHVQG